MERNEAKKQSIPIPAEAVANNIDLLTDIFLRLPVKPLVRLKCISKQWLSLISDPQLCLSYNRHYHTPTPTALLLKKDQISTLKFETIPLKHDTIHKIPPFDYLNAPSLRIRQSCNGLLLCSSFLTGIQFGLENIYYVCNPTTKQFKRTYFPSSELRKEINRNGEEQFQYEAGYYCRDMLILELAEI